MNTKQIAKQIQSDYECGLGVVTDGMVEFWPCDGLLVRCKNNPEAVHAVVEKYRKGFRKSWLTQPTLSPRRLSTSFSIKAFRDFAADGELDNAVEYAKNYGVFNLPIEVQALVRSWA